jgi:ubiquitin C-terminal hydrolase
MRVKHGILALEKGEPPKTVPMIIKKLHKEITSRKINGHRFRHGRQEDAHELLVQLLDYMHEGELIAAGKF